MFIVNDYISVKKTTLNIAHHILNISMFYVIEGLLGSKEPKLISSAESRMVSVQELNFLKVGLSNNSSIDNSC